MTDLPFSRRDLLIAGAGIAAASIPAAAPGPGGEELELFYAKPAGAWVEALPIGNGRLGAMIFGGVAQERIQLNEDTLFAGSPYDPVNPEAREALPVVRRLIDQGRFAEATELARAKVMAKPLGQMPYGSAGDLLIDFHGLQAPSSYLRMLDLDAAVVRTRFAAGKAAYLREAFASSVDHLVVLRFAASGTGRLDFDLKYRHPGRAEYGRPDQPIGADWDHREDPRKADRPAWLSIGPDGEGALLVRGRNQGAEGIEAGLSYALRVKAIGDGRILADADGLAVRGARGIVLLVSIATSYVNYADTGGDPVAAVRAATEAAASRPFAHIEADHLAAHRKLFRSFSLSLGPGRSELPTDARIAALPARPDPGLAALYVQYARYLLLASSRPGSQPANLQGRWNEGTNPPWGGKYTININTEMNYWPAEAANLAECVEPLVRMVEDLAVTGARTARRMYGARGWVAHHNTDLWRASAPVDGPNWGLWPTGGAWLLRTLWDHWDYGRDPAFLRRIWPLLKGACLFFLDTLVDDPKGRGLVTSPSLSPENEHHPGFAIASGPAMDRQILRDLFAQTLAAHGAIGAPDRDFAMAIASARGRLAADRIGAQGQLQEWLEDWDEAAPEPRHRHVSHLYALYPSEQINLRDTPNLARAARTSLERRGDMSTGWAIAWRLCLRARLGEAERAHRILLGLLGPERSYPNLFDAHPPFQIDGNFGGAAGILEMLVQSWGGEIHLLPALPSAWPNGAIRGVRARGRVELDLEWTNGRLARLTLRGPPRAELRLRYRNSLRRLRLDAGGRASLGSGGWTAAPPRI